MVNGNNNTYRASIQDVTITNSSLGLYSGAYNNIGGVSGSVSYANITNVTSDVDVNMTNNSYSSTINYVGSMFGYAAYADIHDLTNYGNFSFQKYIIL